MTECHVDCDDCEKRWSYLCEDCATDMQGRHRRATGHQPHLTVIPDRDDLFALIASVRRA